MKQTEIIELLLSRDHERARDFRQKHPASPRASWESLTADADLSALLSQTDPERSAATAAQTDAPTCGPPPPPPPPPAGQTD